MKSDRRSLSQRLLTWLLLPILGLTALLSVATYFVVLKFANVAYDRALEDSALTLAAQVHNERDQFTIDLPASARKMLEFDEVDRVYYSVTDSGQHSLAGNSSIPAATDNPSNARPNSTRFYTTEIGNRSVRVAEYSEPDRRSLASTNSRIIFRVAETERKRHQMAREVFAFLFIPELLFVFAIASLVWIGIRRGLTPLIAVRDALSKRSALDFTPLDVTASAAEVDEQVHAINTLMARLDTVLDRQRRFTADAAHQLRTPVAAIKIQTELALSQSQNAELNAVLKPIQSTADRLARLVSQLLSLSRAEPNAERQTLLKALTLGDLLEDVLAAHIPSALAKHIDIRLKIAPQLPTLIGDAHLLSEMIANLLDNAIRYTPNKGHIRVSLQMHDTHAAVSAAVSSAESPTGAPKRAMRHLLLSIKDNGPGIALDQHERVFERFYRIAGTASDGSGLGLPIAQEIVHLHSGYIHLSTPTSADGGLTIRVYLPV